MSILLMFLNIENNAQFGHMATMLFYNLFIQMYLKSVPSQFPLWFIT